MLHEHASLLGPSGVSLPLAWLRAGARSLVFWTRSTWEMLLLSHWMSLLEGRLMYPLLWFLKRAFKGNEFFPSGNGEHTHWFCWQQGGRLRIHPDDIQLAHLLSKPDRWERASGKEALKVVVNSVIFLLEIGTTKIPSETLEKCYVLELRRWKFWIKPTSFRVVVGWEAHLVGSRIEPLVGSQLDLGRKPEGRQLGTMY